MPGTHHYRVERDNLQYYLDEFAFRFNRRRSKARGMLFYRRCSKASTPTRTHCMSSSIKATTPGPSRTNC